MSIVFDPVLQMIRSERASYKSVTTTTYTAAKEGILLVNDDTAGAAVTISLPRVADSKGDVYYIKKLGSTGAVTIDPNGSETIDGAATLVLSTKYKAVMIFCDGATWHQVTTTDSSVAVTVYNSASPSTHNLPAAYGSGVIHRIKNINTGAVTVDGNSSDTIDGETTQVLRQWDGIQIIDYAANKWAII